MDHYQQIYSRRAADYQRMIAAEDVDGNLLTALQEITSLRGKRILDLGSGTGRLPVLITAGDEKPGQIVGLDLQSAMLKENLRQRGARVGTWSLLQGDMRRLPLAAGWADVVIAGWAVGHLTGWYPKSWQDEIGQVLLEMQRMVVRGGWLIILETLGTGSLTPAPPASSLAALYAWLEGEWGFTMRTIPTDYQFANIEDAVRKTEFFFGAGLAERIRAHGWARLPEWTGVWFKEAS